MAMAQKIDISSSTIFRVILILLAFWFLYVIRDILLMIIGAIVLAAAIEPIANRLQRYRLPRGLSVILVYILFLAVLVLAFTLLFPLLAEQVLQLAAALPHIVEMVQNWLGGVLPGSASVLAERAQSSVATFLNGVANLGVNVVQQTRSVFSGIVSVVFVFVIALYLVIEENALMKFLRIVIPNEHHTYVSHALTRIHYKIGRWALGQIALGVIVGVTVGVGLWLMGVPYALALGLLAGILEIVPVIGPIVAGFSAVLVAFTQSWLLGLGALIFFILVQQAESHILIPNIMRRATGLNPLVTLLAVLLGARLAGIAGIILAVPVANIIGILLSDVFMAERQDHMRSV
jgi:predicted PurR-regulated permease PerM